MGEGQGGDCRDRGGDGCWQPRAHRVGDWRFVLCADKYVPSVWHRPRAGTRKDQKKFISRFQHMEAEAGDRLFSQMTAEEMDQLWRNAKKEEE